MKSIFLLYGCMVLGNIIATAQNTNTVFQQNHYFSFTYDNDFFNATDRYYTQGIQFKLGLSFVKKSPLTKLLLPLKRDALQQYAITLGQDCFTPHGISRDTLQTSQRPYAGLLYLSHLLTSTNLQKRQQLITQFDIGIIGPCAQCKEMQVSIHRLLDNIQPRGWKFQLANDLVLNYSLQLKQGLWLTKRLELLGYSQIRIGTLYDDLTVGSEMHLGFFKPYFEKQEQINKNKFYIHGLINGSVKLVGYNATLQGGLLNPNDIHILSANEIKRIIASGAAGIIFSYQKVNIEFTRVFMSTDFKNGLSHSWGHINLKFDF